MSVRALLLCQTSDALQLFGESPAPAPRVAGAPWKVWGPREGPPGVCGPKNASVLSVGRVCVQPAAGYRTLWGTAEGKERRPCDGRGSTVQEKSNTSCLVIVNFLVAASEKKKKKKQVAQW